MKLRQADWMRGTVRLPGDKSISHRSAMISAIANGETRIENFSESVDCLSTLNCLRKLGVPISVGSDSITVAGVGLSGLSAPDSTLDCGNSGTTIRLLAGILAGQEFEATLVGDRSLNKRPMQRIVDPLSAMGAHLSSTDGRPPLTIRGRYPLSNIGYEMPVPSAQIKSAILLAGLFADGVTTVKASARSRDHTEKMLELYGIRVVGNRSDRESVSVSPGQPESPGSLTVPADISAAAFFMVGAACLSGSEIVLPGVGINPTRSALINVLKGMGVRIEIANREVRSNEPTAQLNVSGGITPPAGADPVVIGGDLIPNLIDELPILAILGTQLANGLEVRDAAELRHKETDRIAAVVGNLENMGAKVTELPDGFIVKRCKLKGAKIDSYGDHRIAMAFAIAGLIADGETEILGAECAHVSFPAFFETLASVVGYGVGA